MFRIEADFSDADLDALINNDVEIFFDEIVEGMRAVGRDFTERARSKAAAGAKVYNNITWNLVSSIGYCLVDRGVIVESYFPSLKGGTEGEVVGAELAEKLAIYGGDGIALVLVAGEHYSVFLQDRGFDVARNSWYISEGELNTMFA